MISDEHAEWLTHIAFNGQYHKPIPQDIHVSLSNQNFIDRKIGGDVVTGDGWVALIKHAGGGNKDVSPARRNWKIRRRDILRR
jgi:hypothetical protein